MLIGQLDIKVPSIVKAIFFDLFLFTTGYKVGPQFFRGLKKRRAVPGGAHRRPLRGVSRSRRLAFAKLLGYDVGTAAGLLAGAFSESTVIGTAGDAIQRLTLPEAEKTALLNNIPVAYAVTYLVGTASPRLVSSDDRAQADGDQPARRGRADAGRDRRCAEGSSVWSRRPGLRRPRLPRNESGPREQDRGANSRRCP